MTERDVNDFANLLKRLNAVLQKYGDVHIIPVDAGTKDNRLSIEVSRNEFDSPTVIVQCTVLLLRHTISRTIRNWFTKTFVQRHFDRIIKTRGVLKQPVNYTVRSGTIHYPIGKNFFVTATIIFNPTRETPSWDVQEFIDKMQTIREPLLETCAGTTFRAERVFQ